MLVASWLLIAFAVLGGTRFAIHRVERRRARGGARLANTLHLNAKWWRQNGGENGTLLYVAIGDSAAQGVGASKPSRGYVGLIARHLRTVTGHTVQVANLSVSGARLRDAVVTQIPELLKREPDIVTVAIGANDMADFDADRFERELGEIFAALPTHAIVADLPSFYLGKPERNARRANQIVRELARKYGFDVAPLHAETRRQGVARYALNQVAADFFHPNDRGYRVWAGAFLPLIDQFARDRLTADDSGPV